MNIKILAQGDPDLPPLTKTFDYKKDEEFIFFESIEPIKKRISNNLRLNLNETLSFFVAYIITSLNENKSHQEIKNHFPELLSEQQVMIGVPESMRHLKFQVSLNQTLTEIDVYEPIQINSAFLHEDSILEETK